MSLIFVREVWDTLREHMDASNGNDAADSLISLLIDNNYESEDIKDAFSGDKEVLTALKNYVEYMSDSDYYNHDDEEDDTEDEWN